MNLEASITDGAGTIGSEGNLEQVPPNTLLLNLKVLDAQTLEKVEQAEIQIVDREGRLRTKSLMGKKANSRHYICLDISSDTTFLIRAVAGIRLGYATIGTGAGASPISSPHRPRFLTEKRMGLSVVIFVSDAAAKDAAGRAVRVVDASGAPIAGAMVFMHCNLLGQSGADGLIRIVAPATIQEKGDSIWWHEPLAVCAPGKVPVFIKLDQLTIGSPHDVALRADEYVVEFNLKLPPADVENTRITSHSTEYWGRDRGVFARGDDPKQVLARVQWNIERLGYSKKNWADLEAAIGQTLSGDVNVYYDSWYSKQWTYSAESGDLRVVIPHKGQFVIAVNEVIRDVQLPDGFTSREWVLFPGLYIDATDPANPKIELIYAP